MFLVSNRSLHNQRKLTKLRRYFYMPIAKQLLMLKFTDLCRRTESSIQTEPQAVKNISF